MQARILIVDDHPAMRRVLRSMLQGSRFAVDEADSGTIALELASATAYDLVITDIVMPECDGIELIQQMKLIHPNTRFIAISGSVNTANYLKTALFLGADTALPKPVSERELRDAVHTLLPTAV